MTLIVGMNVELGQLGSIALIVADGRYIAPETQQVLEGHKILGVGTNLCVCPAGIQFAELDPSGVYRIDAEKNFSVQAFLRRNPSGESLSTLMRIAQEAVEEGWRLIRPALEAKGLLNQDFKTALLIGGWRNDNDRPSTFLIGAQKNGDDPAQVVLCEQGHLPIGQDDPGTLSQTIAKGLFSAPQWIDSQIPNAAERHMLKTLGDWVQGVAQTTNAVGGPMSACVIRPGMPIFIGPLDTLA